MRKEEKAQDRWKDKGTRCLRGARCPQLSKRPCAVQRRRPLACHLLHQHNGRDLELALPTLEVDGA